MRIFIDTFVKHTMLSDKVHKLTQRCSGRVIIKVRLKIVTTILYGIEL